MEDGRLYRRLVQNFVNLTCEDWCSGGMVEMWAEVVIITGTWSLLNSVSSHMEIKVDILA
jgi:hypothetical protein